ncbi:MAG TPA: hypothetical protein VKU92_04375 [Acidimicrobiales bacterium]|nr:hypothetical protein [Acidimicrobiales bacterium]
MAHAVVDVALGVGLLVAGLHGHGDDYLILDAAGGYLLVVTLVTDARVSLWRLLPRLVHRVLDGAVALAMVASPLIAWRYRVGIDPFATAMAEAVGIIVLRDALVTEHRARRPVSTTARTPIDVAAVEAGVSASARRLGEVSGRLAGRTAARARRRQSR